MPLTKVVEEALTDMDVDTAAINTRGAALPQRTGLTRFLWEVDGGIQFKGDDDLIRMTLRRVRLPVCDAATCESAAQLA